MGLQSARIDNLALLLDAIIVQHGVIHVQRDSMPSLILSSYRKGTGAGYSAAYEPYFATR